MSLELARVLNLELAWRRVKIEQREVFARHPFEVRLVELDLRGWLTALDERIQKDEYIPSPVTICDVPKAKHAVRPGACLSLADQVVYAACVGASLSQIQHELQWADGEVDFAHRILSDLANARWFLSYFPSWREWSEKSIAKLEEGSRYVVFTDITGYYENVDIGILMSDLRQIGVHPLVVQQLSSCLNRWTQVPGRGLPQGCNASDVLGKLYLNSVDRTLRDKDHMHSRYVDDFRFFCPDYPEAKMAIMELSRLLRKRGLNLQSAKTEILPAEEAREKIEGIGPIIKQIGGQFVQDVTTLLGEDDPYVTVAMADSFLRDNPNDVPIEVIREAYRAHFLENQSLEGKQSLLRFLLRRLGKQSDAFALQHATTLVNRLPEETSNLLRYFQEARAVQEVEPLLTSFLGSADAIYPYQIFQIFEWLNSVEVEPSASLMSIARRFAFDPPEFRYLRSVARQFVGKYGTSGSDVTMTAIPHAYTMAACETTDPLAQISNAWRQATLMPPTSSSRLRSYAHSPEWNEADVMHFLRDARMMES